MVRDTLKKYCKQSPAINFGQCHALPSQWQVLYCDIDGQNLLLPSVHILSVLNYYSLNTQVPFICLMNIVIVW